MKDEEVEMVKIQIAVNESPAWDVLYWADGFRLLNHPEYSFDEMLDSCLCRAANAAVIDHFGGSDEILN